MINLLLILILALILGLALRYILRARKRGAKCIGCPYGDSCPARGRSGCSQDRDASSE